MNSDTTSHTNENLLVVIVNYRSANRVVDCLASLQNQIESNQGARVIVVDNDSGDGSLATISQAVTANDWSDWVEPIPAEKNGGFAYGNNLAIRRALDRSGKPKYIWLLNPDTLVRSGAADHLTNFLDENPKVGIAGSALEGEDGERWPIVFRFPTMASEFEEGMRLGLVSKLLRRWIVAKEVPEETQRVEWLPGASFMVRTEVFEQVGLMDERYFLYYEETDFCLRAARLGWHCYYVPLSRVMHIGGESTGVSGRNTIGDEPRKLPQYVFDSRRRYFVKNHGFVYALFADILWISGYSFWLLRRWVQRIPDSDPPGLLKDSIRNSCLFRRDNS